MEVGIHFLFELVKIGILASVYSTVLLIGFTVLAKRTPGSWFDRATEFKRDSWFAMGFIISIILFVYMFTYWGNHGLGDGPRIPIGNWIVVDNTNWSDYGYIKNIKTSDGNNLEMTYFLVEKKQLLGKLESSFYEYDNEYFIYDISRKTMVEFPSRSLFNDYAIKKDLPTSAELLSFEENYRNHWMGWRFWFLP